MKEIEEDIVPFGFIDDGRDAQPVEPDSKFGWAIEFDPNL